MKNPIDGFMNLGSKITKNDPVRTMNFNFYMMAIIFVAFLGILIGNIRNFIMSYELQYLGWSLFALAILWFQYQNLSNMYFQRKMLIETQKAQPIEKADETIELDTIDEMKSGFE